MSESGYPGLKDVQDEDGDFIMSESGYPGLKDIQDEDGDFTAVSNIHKVQILIIKLLWCRHLACTKCTSLNLNLPYYIANCLQQRFAIAMLHTKSLPIMLY
jgi:hypothetical protein